MNGPNQESVELFLQEASEQPPISAGVLRHVAGTADSPDDLEKLYIAAHTLAGTSASYGFPQFSEVAAKMAHIFHYAMNATLTPDMHGPLTEFISDAISVLEFDLLQISSNGKETAGDIAAFKQRYSFAFPAPPSARTANERVEEPSRAERARSGSDSPHIRMSDHLPEDGEIPDEVLEFFVPEAEEHLQAVTECLLALEANPNAEDINRLFRSMHTVKGSAAQVGLHRLSAVAHRVEDLIGQLRDGALHPSANIVDICLESVDVLKKFLHRQWTSDAEMRAVVDPLACAIAELVPEEATEEATQEQCDGRATVQRVPAGELAAPASAKRRAAPEVLPQAKSVRISLDRLDRMMNAVGELVINRTRMVGRLSELAKLVEVLNFSKSRLVRQNFRISGEARIQPDQPVAGSWKPPAADGYLPAEFFGNAGDHVE